MDVHGTLDAIIAAIPNHRQYHPGLVNQLATTFGAHSEHRNNAVLIAQHGKQVKRLVNQSLSTLTRWSKVLHSPERSDVIARGVTSAPVSTLDPATAISEALATGTENTSATETDSGNADRQRLATATTRGARLPARKTRPTPGAPIEINPPCRHSGPVQSIERQGTRSSSTASETSSSTTTTGPTRTELFAEGRQKEELERTSASNIYAESLYCTDRPTYAHIAMLVDISFLGIECLENMSQEIPTGTFEIEKARSNLASKIIELGMVTSITNRRHRLILVNVKRRQQSTKAAIVFGLNTRKNVPCKSLAV